MEGVVALFSIGVLLSAACAVLLVAGYLVLAVFGVVYGVFLVLRWAWRCQSKQADTGGME